MEELPVFLYGKYLPIPFAGILFIVMETIIDHRSSHDGAAYEFEKGYFSGGTYEESVLCGT
jgi:hypothetical protein